MHKILFFPENENNKEKKIMCAYPTLNFQTRYPKHTYFFFWPYYLWNVKHWL